MNYAVIKSGGKQYKVSEGDTIEVDNLDIKDGEKVVFDRVLLKVNENGVKVGTPTVKGEKVEGKLIKAVKGDKVRVSKFKAKVRYRKVNGFRASLSQVLIEKI